MRSGKWEKARILLVDDDGPIRSSLRIFFEAEGYEFLGVESAEKGLEEVGRQHYDVIIADYRLPGMNGLEFFILFCRTIATIPHNGKTRSSTVHTQLMGSSGMQGKF